ncbi:MAG: hypothetical protein KDA99_18550 [Planctomycetales bacterium]|nr:hypothetical protein [Planctomycetales bacterium]
MRSALRQFILVTVLVGFIVVEPVASLFTARNVDLSSRQAGSVSQQVESTCWHVAGHAVRWARTEPLQPGGKLPTLPDASWAIYRVEGSLFSAAIGLRSGFSGTFPGPTKTLVSSSVRLQI